jgi:F0F1-type ATP synthase assembly protein I
LPDKVKAGCHLVATDPPNARRLAFGVVLGQAVVTGIVALLSFALAGPKGATSAMLGGGISTLASLGMAVVAFGRTGAANAQRAVLTFYVGEAVKLALIVVMFIGVLKVMKVSPLPLFAGYMATFLVYWIVLARWLRNPNGS